MRSIRVLHIASGDLWAGAEVQIYLLLKELATRSSESLKVVLMNGGELADRLAASGLDVVIADEKLHGSAALLKRISSVLRSFKPDVIHTHRCKENILGLISGWSGSGAKIVRTIHGRNELAATWKAPRRWLVDLVDEVSGKYACDAVIAVSGDLAQELRASGWGNVICIPNGIDVNSVFDRQCVPGFLKKSDGFHIGFVGRLEPVKRCDLFIRIAAYAASEGWNQFKWHVFGDGSQMSALRAQTRGYGLADYVAFHGHRSEAVEWLGALDVLVMPSDHEGMPMVLLESLAAGTPVVGHAVGGIKEILSQGAGGVLVNQQDPNIYAEAIRRLVPIGKSPQHRQAAQRLVAEKYSIARVATQTSALYAKVVQ